MRTLTAATLFLFCCAVPAFAQNDFHVIPQVADGVFPDGTSYRTEFMILPWFETTASTTCTLRLHSLVATLTSQSGQVIAATDAVPFTILQGSFAVFSTAGNQAFDQGYATITCDQYVFAQALYTFFAPDGTKYAEATVFSSEGEFNTSFRLVLDQRGGARLGIAIANNTDIPRSYRLAFGSIVETVEVPGRTSLARFVDEVMTLPANSVGVLKVEATDFSTGFGVIGIRMTGSVFTTIPAN